MVTSESWIVETVKARNEGVSVIGYLSSAVRVSISDGKPCNDDV